MNRFRLFLTLGVVLTLSIFVFGQEYISSMLNTRHQDAVNAANVLPPQAQSGISNTLGRADSAYHIAATHDGYRAYNSAQDLTATFSPESVLVQTQSGQWQLMLRQIGYGQDRRVVAPSTPRAYRHRVEYQRDGLTE